MKIDSRARLAFGVLGGVMLVLSSAAHAFLGWPQMRAALVEVGAGAELVSALQVGWHFGSTAMLVFGLIVLRIATGRLDRCAVRFIALGYLVFGAAAFLARDLNPHFLLFVATGIVLALFAFTDSS